LTEIFRDDFNDQSIDDKKWTVGSGNSTVGLPYLHSENVYETSDYLFIRSQRRQYSGRDFTSGQIYTGRKFEFLYGEVEWRAKLSAGQGVGSYLQIGQNEAISFMARGDYTDMIQPTVFYQSKLGSYESSSRSIYGADDTVGGFHIFKVIWESNQIIWLIDGRQIWNITESEKIPHQKAQLLMAGNVGTAWTGVPVKTTFFPTRMLIDYVTVHQWK
jgi:beta-glucanase (GH16 family)